MAASLLDLPRVTRTSGSRRGGFLDLYEGHWNGIPLRDDEFVISTDEKTEYPGSPAYPRVSADRAPPSHAHRT